MKKLMIILMSVILISCNDSGEKTKKVAVSIVPQATFVQAVAGDLVEVEVMIPPGYSPANYQPSPKEMTHLDDALIYFYLDVPAEQNIMNAIKNDGVELVDLAEAVDAVYPARFFEAEEDHDDGETDEHEEDHDDHDHDHTGRDPHIWLSPRRVIVMVETIRDELIEIDPENRETYVANAEVFMEELKVLDAEFNEVFKQTSNKTFLIYHPSYGYFADDYGLNMIAIEDEGKEATIQGIEHIIEFSKEQDIHVIFYQEEFDSQQAEIIAKEIEGVTVEVTPLSGNYLESMRFMVSKLKSILE